MQKMKICYQRVGSWWRDLGMGASCARWIERVRYPVSLPIELSNDLGLPSLSSHSFHGLLHQLCNPRCHPSKLVKYMPRKKAERTFVGAVRQERFPERTLCSYYFHGAWLEFTLVFDYSSRLRRLYVQHRELKNGSRVEIPLRLLCLQ